MCNIYLSVYFLLLNKKCAEGPPVKYHRSAEMHVTSILRPFSGHHSVIFIEDDEELTKQRSRRGIRVIRNGHKFKKIKPTDMSADSDLVMYVGRSIDSFSYNDELKKCEIPTEILNREGTSGFGIERFLDGLVYTMDGWEVEHDTDLIHACQHYAKGKRLCRPGRANRFWVEYSHDCLCGKLTLKGESLKQSTILCQRIETDEGDVHYTGIQPMQMATSQATTVAAEQNVANQESHLITIGYTIIALLSALFLAGIGYCIVRTCPKRQVLVSDLEGYAESTITSEPNDIEPEPNQTNEKTLITTKDGYI